METLEEKLARVLADEIEVVPYNSLWVDWYLEEQCRLIELLPGDLIVRIEHIGSTAVPGLAAKPIVDMAIEITGAERGRILIPKTLEPLGYDCFWRPSKGDDIPPWYTWCIRRNEKGIRTHHLHFVESGGKDEELRFRDILRAHPDIAGEYGKLKFCLAQECNGDRIRYTDSKTEFIRSVLGGCNEDERL